MASLQPMLAETIKDIKDLQYPVLGSEKIDGLRCLIIEGKAVTRSLKPIKNLHIRNTLETWYKDLPIKPFLIDGEITVNGDFAATASGVMTIKGEPNFVYQLFDFLGSSGSVHDSFNNRLARLEAFVTSLAPKVDFIKVLKHYTFTGPEDLLIFEEMILDMGGEGVMVRALHGSYKYGRSTLNEGWLLKLKRFEEDEAEIIGFEEKMINNNEPTINARGNTERASLKENMIPADTLGALVVKHCKTGVEFKVGSGFNPDSLRDKIWANRDKYLGKIITYKSFTQTGVKDKPRFPIYKGVRQDL